jgi:hypothetical protein
MEIPMQSARESKFAAATAAPGPRATAINRTLVWFSGDAERRRRAAAVVQEALSGLPMRSAVPASGASAAAAAIRPRPEAFGHVALAALVLATVGGLALSTAGPHTCRTAPAVLASGTDVDVKMTVARNAACAISAKAVNVPVIDLEIAVPPQHGMLTLRGRTGVTYRPGREFTGEDSFSFALRGAPAGRDGASLVRVQVSVTR